MRPDGSRIEASQVWARLLLDGPALAIGVVAGLVVWALDPSLPLAVVSGAVVAASAHGTSALLLGRHRVRRALYHLLSPALLLGSFSVAIAAWGAEWLAALTGFAVAAVVTPAARRTLFPDLFLDHAAERRRELEQLAA